MLEFPLKPWHLIVLAAASQLNGQQQCAIEYLETENSALREKLGTGRILLNDDQRRRLALIGHVLGRKALSELVTIVTPDTVLRWHRQLVAMKWDYSDRRKSTGQPPVLKAIAELVVRMARENRDWGYDCIESALANQGHTVSDTTVGNILREHGHRCRALATQEPKFECSDRALHALHEI